MQSILLVGRFDCLKSCSPRNLKSVFSETFTTWTWFCLWKSPKWALQQEVQECVCCVCIHALYIHRISISYVHACILSCFSPVWLCATLWTWAHQSPLPMGFSRQEYCRGLPFSSPGDLLDPGIKPASLVSLALTGGFFTAEPLGNPIYFLYIFLTVPPCFLCF